MKISISMGNVWDRTTEFLGDHLSTIVPVALLAIVLPSALSTLIEPVARAGASAAVMVNLAALILGIVGIWGQLFVVALALQPGAGRGAAMRVAGSRLLPLIGIIVILMLAVFALMLPVPIALIATGFDMRAAMINPQPTVSPSAGWFITVYLIVLIPLMIFVTARLLLLTSVIVAERRGIGVIRRSFALTRGMVWKIIGVTILYGIVVLVAMMAARTVFGSVLRIVLGGEGLITPATVLTAVVLAIVQAIFVVLASAFCAQLYLAVRDARDPAESALHQPAAESA
ncbi:hypothetical protein H5J25_05310 [Sphingomonas aliaeris]|uniref:Glycerophosphoryl diester phosphodiesterase membrane domain-containing protein n=1 Tax=Sphingomonas aliaeris TaxID=2759526 RepID=A0A974NW41_9SPHN|nr:hypothetical protein [Sphingomonas aliaeris]QQV78139.1 hypothetical protein H5J25_05310 [Sphingomonas aliaeris]